MEKGYPRKSQQFSGTLSDPSRNLGLIGTNSCRKLGRMTDRGHGVEVDAALVLSGSRLRCRMGDSPPQLSVIICTHNRPESLAITLECLASANRNGIQAELVVVNNASQGETEAIVWRFAERIPIRYLYEPQLGIYGKSHALNRALDAGRLGEIIAVLDDDMSPGPDWFQAVIAICNRWPEKDIFTGDTYPIWPHHDVPGWARKSGIQSWIFSAQRVGRSDLPLEDGKWFSGNHFWFRSRVLAGRRRFRDTWLTEPDFQLDLAELGFAGVSGPDAVAGHRVQSRLLDEEAAISRARKTGYFLRSFARRAASQTSQASSFTSSISKARPSLLPD